MDSWRFCPIEDNPADLLTRGITSLQLKSSRLWEHGPQWLPSHTSWPTWKFSPTIGLQALAVTATEFQPTTSSVPVSAGMQFANYSSHSRLLAVTAYISRFIHNCQQQPPDRLSGPLTPLELLSAEMKWVKQCQHDVYRTALSDLTFKSSSKKRTTIIRQLNLFLDNDGLIRCKERIHNAPLSTDTKFPLLLPPKHKFTSLVILKVHTQLFHGGTNATLTMIRQKYQLAGKERSHCSVTVPHAVDTWENPIPYWTLRHCHTSEHVTVDHSPSQASTLQEQCMFVNPSQSRRCTYACLHVPRQGQSI